MTVTAKLKQRIFSPWSFSRAIFAVTGIFIMIQSVIEHQWTGLVLGTYFASMGIFAFGCAGGNCYTGSGSTQPSAGQKTESRDMEFEEIKVK